MFAKPWTGDHKGTFYGLDELQLKILINFIRDQHPEQLTAVIQTRLMEFAHAGHSLPGLYNFVVWSLNVEHAPSLIIETVDHDLSEMHTRLFVPRSSEYENMEVDSDRDQYSPAR